VKCELTAKVLRSFGTVRLRVTGLSMFPAVCPGDLVLIRRREIGEVAPGEIVLFARRGGLVAHRVVSRKDNGSGERLTTRGDALPAEDLPVGAEELLGTVCLFFRDGAWIEPPKRRGYGARLLSALVCRSPRVAGVLIRLRAVRRSAGRKSARGKEAACEV